MFLQLLQNLEHGGVEVWSARTANTESNANKRLAIAFETFGKRVDPMIK